MKKTKKLLSLLLAVVLVASMLTVGAASASAAVAKDNAYSDAAMALDDEYAYDGELGAIYSPQSTTFKVWAPLATSVTLYLYSSGSDEEEDAHFMGEWTLQKLLNDDGTWTGVWARRIDADLKNIYYTYSITNPQHITGSKFTKRKETQDIYSYAVGVNGKRSMIVDLDATDPEGWEDDRHVFVDNQSDAVIWELQVKDFSYSETSGVSEENRGKYLAFTENGTTLNNEGDISTCIDYLKELGITHVQINPFYDFGSIDETGSDDQYNWGYDPVNYGVPEGSFSSNPYDGNVRITEAKKMIQALHNAGIGVIMDVVYNHTYSTDSCFTACVPEYYYRMASDGSYSQQSGCGNDTASERAMYRKYMRDMLTYWTNEYHIDGFRFDLMGVHDGETMNLIRDDLDAIDSRILMYGEAWSGDTVYDPETCAGTATFMATQSNASKLSSRIAMFNDQIRDGIKGKSYGADISDGFVSGNKVLAPNLSVGVRANTEGRAVSWTAQSPEQCLTYASCHDGFTMYDQLVSVNYGDAAPTDVRYSDIITQNKQAAAILGSSQGIEFILAGEEMGRTKHNDHNSYKSSPTINQIDWSLLRTNADLVSYYKGMFELRSVFSPFTASVKDSLDDSYEYIFETSMTGSVPMVAYTVHNSTEGEWDKIAVIYNSNDTEKTFTFKGTKDKTINKDTEWVIVANDKAAGITKLGESKGLSFKVPASSAIIAVEKSTFEACNLQSMYSKVNVESVYTATGEKLAESTILGIPGTGYAVEPDNSIALEYELSSVDGDEVGVFADEDTTVTYEYVDYIPTAFRAPYGDLNDDGEVDVIDLTILQRALAGIVELDDEVLARADYNVDGDIDMLDVSYLQRYLAGMIKPVYSVTTRYLAVNEATGAVDSIASMSTSRVRYGEEYTTTPAKIAYYTVDETPANASGVVRRNVLVDYYYSYSVKSPVIHIKHDGEGTWAPTLWAWAYDENGKAINCYEGWPGYTVTDVDDDGWFTTTFPIPGGLDYYYIISNNGTPQTMDYGPISYDDYPEIWVVIHDDMVGKNNGNWTSYYDHNPELFS